MTQAMFNLIIGSVLRSAVMIAAGWLVSKGLLPQGTVEEWAGAVVLVLLGLGWSVYSHYQTKWKHEEVVSVALALPPGSSHEELAAALKEDK